MCVRVVIMCLRCHVHIMSEGKEIGCDLTDALLQMNQKFLCVSRDE